MENSSLSSLQKSSLNELVTILSSQDVFMSCNNIRVRGVVTELIRVPTQEHVAQIVGKYGIKIKTLRAKTNTFIRSPLRGDRPIFSITGTAEDVQLARMAIEEASHHFSDLMRARSTCADGEVSTLVPVPHEYIGLVVGRRGSAIMNIKERTNTRINTPRRHLTAFEVTGLPDNVFAAKEAIIAKVRQALPLRSSPLFDPNFTQSLISSNAKAIQMPQSFNKITYNNNSNNVYLQIQSPISYPMPNKKSIDPHLPAFKSESNNSEPSLFMSEHY